MSAFTNEIIQFVLHVLEPIVAVLITAILWKYLGKIGIEKNAAVNSLIESYVEQGVNYVEKWSEKQVSVTSEDKLVEATKYVVSKLNESGLPKMAEDKIISLIESKLAKKENTNATE